MVYDFRDSLFHDFSVFATFPKANITIDLFCNYIYFYNFISLIIFMFKISRGVTYTLNLTLKPTHCRE